MEKAKKSLDFNGVTGLITIVLALIYGFKAYTLPRAAFGNPMAPCIYPLILSGVLLILGLILFLKSGMKSSILSFQRVKKEASNKDRLNWKMIIQTCIICVAYALVFDHLGYVISTFAFLQIVLGILNGKKKWKTNTIVAFLFSVGVYVIFSKLLGIYLPKLPYFYI